MVRKKISRTVIHKFDIISEDCYAAEHEEEDAEEAAVEEEAEQGP